VSSLSDTFSVVDPLFSRAQILVYPLFVSAYIVEFGIGSIFGDVHSHVLGYVSRTVEGVFLISAAYILIYIIHKLLMSFKVFNGRIQVKGIVFMLLAPYGLLGLCGTYFNATEFGSPSLWHVTALAFAFALLHEQREEIGNEA
jgi:hypothetical protein